jgi:hypothetical protein
MGYREKKANDESNTSSNSQLTERAPRKTNISSRRRVVIISILILLAVVIGESEAAVYIADNTFFVGVVSESQIFNLTGRQLTVTYSNITGNYNSKNVTEFKEILLSAISGPGKLSISSLEFSSSLSSLAFYKQQNQIWKQNLTQFITTQGLQNVTHDHFSVFYFSTGGLNSYELISVGRAGAYAFVIIDTGTSLSSYKTLIDDEVRVMRENSASFL